MHSESTQLLHSGFCSKYSEVYRVHPHLIVKYVAIGREQLCSLLLTWKYVMYHCVNGACIWLSTNAVWMLVMSQKQC